MDSYSRIQNNTLLGRYNFNSTLGKHYKGIFDSKSFDVMSSKKLIDIGFLLFVMHVLTYGIYVYSKAGQVYSPLYSRPRGVFKILYTKIDLNVSSYMVLPNKTTT